MAGVIGTALLWLLAITLIAIGPLSEFARGMASNPDVHPHSRGAWLVSVVGLILLGLLIE